MSEENIQDSTQENGQLKLKEELERLKTNLGNYDKELTKLKVVYQQSLNENTLFKDKLENYAIAFNHIAEGKSLANIYAESYLKTDKPKGFIKRGLGFLGKNLAAIATLVIAFSGVYFAILQNKDSQKKIDLDTNKMTKELQITKAQATGALIPYLTSDNPRTRMFGFSTLLSMSFTTEEIERLRFVAERLKELGDAEAVEIFASQLSDEKLKKDAAELYAKRAELNRVKASSEPKPEIKAELFNQARNDANKAINLDNKNITALYQLGRFAQYKGENVEALGNFENVVNLIETTQPNLETEDLYLRSLLNLSIIYNELKKTKDVICKQIDKTETAYKIASQLEYLQEKESEFISVKNEQKCSARIN